MQNRSELFTKFTACSFLLFPVCHLFCLPPTYSIVAIVVIPICLPAIFLPYSFIHPYLHKTYSPHIVHSLTHTRQFLINFIFIEERITAWNNHSPKPLLWLFCAISYGKQIWVMYIGMKRRERDRGGLFFFFLFFFCLLRFCFPAQNV